MTRLHDGPHGLQTRPRVSELVDLRWVQVDLDNATLHVRRVKHGTPATHPLTGVELRALRKLQRETNVTIRLYQRAWRAVHQPGFQTLVERAGKKAKLEFKAHPHMLRLPAATSWLTMASIPARSKAISGTSPFSTQFVTPTWRRPLRHAMASAAWRHTLLALAGRA